MDGFGIYSGGEGEIVEKKSTFIGAVAPAHSEAEALAFIEAKKKEHYKARHNCYAYVVGDEGELARSSDDGEPSGTAGRPMLDVLQGRRLHNVVAVVTRYFGGVLLGTGGLVRAYTRAVEEGIAACCLMERRQVCPMTLSVDYTTLGRLQHFLKEREVSVTDISYENDATLSAMVPPGQRDTIEKGIIDLTGGRYAPVFEEPVFTYFPLSEKKN